MIFRCLLPISIIIASCLGVSMAKSADNASKAQLEAQSEQIQQQLTEFKKQLDSLQAKTSEKQKTSPTTEPHPPLKQNLSPEDTQAAQSSLFLPGGSPKPLSNKNQSTGSIPQPPAADADSDNQTDRDSQQDQNLNNQSDNHDDSDPINTSINHNNQNRNFPGGFPFDPDHNDHDTSIQLAITPMDAPYDFAIAKLDQSPISPYQSISGLSDSLRWTFKDTHHSYAGIRFCQSDYQHCSKTFSLSQNRITLSSDAVDAIEDHLDYTSISIDQSQYHVGTVSFELTRANHRAEQTQVTFPFQGKGIDCQKNTTKLNCQMSQSVTRDLTIH